MRTGIAIMAMAQASSASGQAPGAAPAAPADAARSAAQGEDAVIVVAQPSERSSIDRTTYVVRDNAEARSSNVLDLLGQVPSVEVTPNGLIRLLGRSGVKILIDGNEVGNPLELLRNMQGSQIARIEVISNPSAQFSAQGTAGIINIVTRRSFAAGLGGSLTASAGSFGAYDVKASPTWSRGPLSLSGSLGVARSASRGEFERDRRIAADGGPAREIIERGETRTRFDSVTGNMLASYRPAPRHSVTFNGLVVAAEGRTSNESEFLSSIDGGTPFRQTASGLVAIDARDLSIEYRREGGRQSETLTVSAKRQESEFRTDTRFETEFGPGELGLFRLRSDNSYGATTVKLDYLLPFAGVRRLSLGGQMQRTSRAALTRQDGRLPLGRDPIFLSSTIRGAWLETAAYMTYQLPLLGGTVLAGLRVEDRRYDLAGDTPSRGPRGTYLFPSLHLERGLARSLTANLSYSRRIAWPDIADLDPALRFSDSTTARGGNPLLRPELTDSLEAKLKAQFSGQNVELTLYSRRTRDLFSELGEVDDDGVLVTRPVNLGTRTSRGASLSAGGALGGGFRYAATANLADQDIRGDGIGVDLAEGGIQHSGSAQLDWRDGVEGRRGADHVMVRLRYSGPIDQGLFRISPFASANASWSHAFTDRLSGVLTVSDLVGATIRATYFSGASVSEQRSRVDGPRVSFALTYSLGPPAR